MGNFLSYILAQYPQTGWDLINEYLTQFANLMGLPGSWFQGTNLIFYLILPVITGIYLVYLMLEKLRIFRDKTVNYLLAFSMGFFLIYVGKFLLYITIPLIIWFKLNIYHGYRFIPLLINFGFKVVLIGVALWGLSSLSG